MTLSSVGANLFSECWIQVSLSHLTMATGGSSSCKLFQISLFTGLQAAIPLRTQTQPSQLKD